MTWWTFEMKESQPLIPAIKQGVEESNERKMGRECQTSLKCVPEAAAMSSGWALPTHNWLSLPGTKTNAKKDHDNV
ncbi:hypothetical protein BELL_0066g00110 [Botrytis elliptica]|uniref:Uncharacterized protein n=1 Tax=Botrytis elliptica TaxID=278938 RepID=A0A4Z1JY38_9HELO|nr:hypothetical protein EAE99_005338 [Botrytis elliptica]TGO78448.1 hypothetical protein BELL_0066g00110 [Botrytis elliptica]